MSDKASVEARDHLVRALEADLVGPFDPDKAEEKLPLPPSRWYLTGFLASDKDRDPEDPTSEDDEDNALEEEDDDETQAQGQETAAKQKRLFPASIGLSVLLPPGPSSDTVDVTLSFARYLQIEDALPGEEKARRFWQRQPPVLRTVSLPLDPVKLRRGTALPGEPGVLLKGQLETTHAPGIPKDTRALSLFVVNETPIEDKRRKDEAFVFQVRMLVDFDKGFVPRPNRQGEVAEDWDDQVADLQFRDRMELAVGHGVAVAPVPRPDHVVTRIRTTWLPQTEVRRVVTHEEPSVTTDMNALAAFDTEEAVLTGLGPLVEAYGKWLRDQQRIEVDGAGRKATRDALLNQAEQARARIQAGIDRVARDPEVRLAFRLMNRAMALSALKRSPHRYKDGESPKWRMFQLAFVLLNIESIATDTHKDRDNVELIFFPTGGGKTEAYLGVIAFALLLRRLRGQARPDKGLGVAVLLRYTLRLLTLDQLGRAATLVCALETLRREHKAQLGSERFAVGLWVGRSATANTLAQLKGQVIDYKNNVTPNSPFPLAVCPWCGEKLTPDSLSLVPNPQKPEGVVVGCSDFRCDFSARKTPEGLPVVFVDEQVYRELPCFVVATIDKFAMLPWRGETGMLFGRVGAKNGNRFYGPMDKRPKAAEPLIAGLRPPELIVQDELHLISGPLGTMAGLYETAIDALCTYENEQGIPVRPKILASTATVRRAREQIQALFGRKDHALFPPPAVDASETWFAKVDPKSSGRLYVGVAAQGRSLKGLLLRSYVSLLGAGARAYAGQSNDVQPNPADPYMTVAGYFNSLRELGGMRRLVEDDVRSRCQSLEDKRPEGVKGAHPWFKNRAIQPEPVELTSRESTNAIKDAKDRLNLPSHDSKHVDVLLASNMISVGVDIDRLGLMVVAGQPKTTAEYIQASSRVGRSHPGLVVTCFNVTKPRDRSHYERFQAYHESFYRFVEATSLTPFSGPALDRGLAGTLVAMARLLSEQMTPASAVMQVDTIRATLGEDIIAAIGKRAGIHDDMSASEHERLVSHIRERAEKLFDAWRSVTKSAREGAGKRSYSRFDAEKAAGKPLLMLATDPDLEHQSEQEKRFVAPTSMRDVEETVHLWVDRGRYLGSKS